MDEPPISYELMRGLFDFLDRTDRQECNRTFMQTQLYLRMHNIREDEVLKWLQENGAGCDCEVMFNIEDEWGEIVRRDK